MKILYVCQYFPPEVCAPAVRADELSREWARAGHQVSVLTGFPNHPEGVIHPEYLPVWRKGFSREDREGVEVYRTWLYPAANRGLWRRSANYLSFAAAAALTGSWLCPGGGIVIATSPPLPVAVAGYVMARSRKAQFVFEVRDLWPESLEAVGAAPRHSVPYSSLERMAQFLYRHADRIVVDGEGKRKAISALGIADGKLAIIRSGVSEDLCFPPDSPEAQQTREAFRARHNLTGKFVALYCGTLGMAHGLETVLEAAARLENRHDIAFLFAGEGAEREKICRRVSDLGLRNVRYLGKQPRTAVPELLAAADTCLVPLRPSDVFRTAIPSKMFEAMAAAKPVVLAVEGEAKDLMLEAQAGIAVPPGNPSALAEAVLRLRKNPELAHKLGANGRCAALTKYTRRQQATAYLEVLNEIDYANPQITGIADGSTDYTDYTDKAVSAKPA